MKTTERGLTSLRRLARLFGARIMLFYCATYASTSESHDGLCSEDRVLPCLGPFPVKRTRKASAERDEPRRKRGFVVLFKLLMQHVEVSS